MCLSLCSRLCHWGPLVALGKKNLRKYHTQACNKGQKSGGAGSTGWG